MLSRTVQEKALLAILEHSLLNDGPLSDALFNEVLTEYADEVTESLHDDADDALICLVVEDGHVAMMLVEATGAILSNEQAREKLIQMWRSKYAQNIAQIIPIFASHLKQGMLAVAGIKWVWSDR